MALAMGKSGKEYLPQTTSEKNKNLLGKIIKYGLIAVGALAIINWIAKI